MGVTGRGAQRQRGLVQAHVPEQLLAVSRFTAATDGGAGPRSDRDGPAGAPSTAPFPRDVWLAVSRARIYAFAARGDDVGDLAGVWDRSDTEVAKAERLTRTALTLRVQASGPQLALSARRGTPGTRAVVRLLRDPTRDH